MTGKELGPRKPWETVPGQPSFRRKLHARRPYSALFRPESNSITKFFALLPRKIYRDRGGGDDDDDGGDGSNGGPRGLHLFAPGEDYFRERRGGRLPRVALAMS